LKHSEQSKRNRRAVTLFWNGQQQVQEVSGGSGFAAQKTAGYILG